jgi:hypothetical protein
VGFSVALATFGLSFSGSFRLYYLDPNKSFLERSPLSSRTFFLLSLYNFPYFLFATQLFPLDFLISWVSFPKIT